MKTKRRFELIELLVIVAIICVLLAMVMTLGNKSKDHDTHKNDVETVKIEGGYWVVSKLPDGHDYVDLSLRRDGVLDKA